MNAKRPRIARFCDGYGVIEVFGILAVDCHHLPAFQIEAAVVIVWNYFLRAFFCLCDHACRELLRDLVSVHDCLDIDSLDTRLLLCVAVLSILSAESVIASSSALLSGAAVSFFPFFRRCGCTAALLVTAVGDHIDFSFFYQDFHNLRKLRPFCFRHLQQHGNVFQTHRLIVFRAYEIHEQRLAVFQQFRTSGTRMARMTAMVPAVLSCMGRRVALRIFPPIFFLLIIFHLLSPLCRKRHPYAFSWE